MCVGPWVHESARRVERAQNWRVRKIVALIRLDELARGVCRRRARIPYAAMRWKGLCKLRVLCEVRQRRDVHGGMRVPGWCCRRRAPLSAALHSSKELVSADKGGTTADGDAAPSSVFNTPERWQAKALNSRNTDQRTVFWKRLG